MNRELPFDVIFVGGGPASLSAAIHLTNLIKKHNETGQGPVINYENRIAVLEKGAYFGAHATSGAILDPVALNELMPNHLEQGFPLEAKITQEDIYYLTSKYHFRLPYIPPFLENRGNYIVSLTKMVGWMAKQAEKNDVVLLKEVAAVDFLGDEKEVSGVKSDDRFKDEKYPGGFRYPGYQLKSKVTVLGEGSAGFLTRKAVKRFRLDEGKSPAIYELGVKEVYELKEGVFPEGRCVHLMGYPLTKGKSGGVFMYGMAQNRLAIGLIAHLGATDPNLDVHQELQRVKLHPMVKEILRDGQVVSYGAKTLPCGGFYTIPKLTYPGLMLIGDGANLVDSRKLKGLHTAMKSGMLVAEVLFEAYCENNFSFKKLERYDELFKQSFIYKDLKKSRNFTQALEMGIPFPGGPLLGFQLLTGGANITGRLKIVPDFKKTRPLFPRCECHHHQCKEGDGPLYPDDKFVIDKLSDVFLSRTMHDEHQDSHIIIPDPSKCEECYTFFDSPCRKFCPAQVYELEEGEGDVSGSRKHKIQINFSNCLHCKTCDLKCPKENIIWNLPEAGGGPQYTIQ